MSERKKGYRNDKRARDVECLPYVVLCLSVCEWFCELLKMFVKKRES